MNQLVSILMPVYNCEKYLKLAINSIIEQTYRNFELIIINDASTDSSKEIIFSFKDQRIKYFENLSNLKIIDTLNRGFQLCSGEFILRMDADDISESNRIAEVVSFLNSNQNIGIVSSYFELINESEELNSKRFLNKNLIQYPTDHKHIKFSLIFNNVILHPAVAFRKNILEKHGETIYKKKYLHAEEYKLWTELILDYNFANIPKYLLKYRLHQNQISSIFNEIQSKNAQIIQLEYLNSLGFKFTDKEAVTLISFFQQKIDSCIKFDFYLKTLSFFLKQSNNLNMDFDFIYINKLIDSNLKKMLFENKFKFKFSLFKYKQIRSLFWNSSFKQKIYILTNLI